MYEFEVIKVKKPSERDWAFPRRVLRTMRN